VAQIISLKMRAHGLAAHVSFVAMEQHAATNR